MHTKATTTLTDQQYDAELRTITMALLVHDLRRMRAAWKAGARNQKYRCRTYGIPYIHIDYEAIFERDRWQCGICHQPVHIADASLDHIMPLYHGGLHTPENVQCAHLQCNRLKWTKT